MVVRPYVKVTGGKISAGQILAATLISHFIAVMSQFLRFKIKSFYKAQVIPKNTYEKNLFLAKIFLEFYVV